MRRAKILALALGLPAIAGSMELVPTEIGRLAVYESGQDGGETLVLWHSIFMDSSSYDTILPALEADYRVIRIDGPGHGASDPAPRGTNIQDHARALIGVLDALDVPRAAVVGTSWGGMVGGWAATQSPEHIVGIAFLNTPFFLGEGRPSFANRMIVAGGRMSLRTRVYRNGVASSFFLPSTIEASSPAVSKFHAHLLGVDRPGIMRAIKSVLMPQDPPLVSVLSGIRQPTVVVAGRHDDMYPLERMRQAADALPNGQLHVVDSAHISVVDAPEETLAILESFLAGLYED